MKIAEANKICSELKKLRDQLPPKQRVVLSDGSELNWNLCEILGPLALHVDQFSLMNLASDINPKKYVIYHHQGDKTAQFDSTTSKENPCRPAFKRLVEELQKWTRNERDWPLAEEFSG